MKSIQTKFLGLDITVINHEDKPYVPMKQIAENIGLDWKAQYRRISDNEVLSSTMVIMTTVAEDGKKREMVCLPLHYLNGWLFGIKPSKVKPEIDRIPKRMLRSIMGLLDAWRSKMERYSPAT